MDDRLNSKELKQLSDSLNYTKNSILLKKIADELVCSVVTILEENKKDILDMNRVGIDQNIIQNCTLDKRKIYEICAYVVSMVEINISPNETLINDMSSDGYVIKKITTPIESVAVVYGIDPYIFIIISIMCLKCGNNVTLFGSKELYRTERAMFNIIKECMDNVNFNNSFVELVKLESKNFLNNILEDGEFNLTIFANDNSLKECKISRINVPHIFISKDSCCWYIDNNCDFRIIDKVIGALDTDPNIQTIVVHNDIYKEFFNKYKNNIYNLEVKVVDGIKQAIGYINNNKYLSRICVFTNNYKAINTFKSRLTLVSMCINNIYSIENINNFYSLLPIKLFIDNIYNKIPLSLDCLLCYKYILEKIAIKKCAIL